MRALYPIVLLSSLLAGCPTEKDDDVQTDDTDEASGDDDTADSEDSGDTEDSGADTDDTGGPDDTDDTDASVEPNPYGVQGVWTGGLTAIKRSYGDGFAGSYDNTTSCTAGTLTLHVDLDASPQVQLASFTCPGVGVTDLSIEGDLPLDGNGDIFVSASSIYVNVDVGSDDFGATTVPAFVLFEDDDDDDIMDKVTGRMDATTVVAIGMMSDNTWVRVDFSFTIVDLVRTGDLP